MRALVLAMLLVLSGCSGPAPQETPADRGATTEMPAAKTQQTASAQPTTPKKASSDNLIDPEAGIGPIKFGMTAEQAAAAGRAALNETAEEDRRIGVVLAWPRTKVFANAAGPPGHPEGPHRVFSVRTNNPRFHTKAGLRVGSTLAEAKRLYGRPDPEASLDIPGTGGEAVWASGLSAEYDVRGTITCIEVNSP